MKLPVRSLWVLVLGVTLIVFGPALMCAQEPAGGAQPLSSAEVDTLVAPIALYPDPLISQILPAATYPDDIQAAASWLAQNPNNPNGIDAQGWDLSVKAVAHYPQVIEKMAGDMDWTLALGQAYSLQQEDVLESVQRLRGLAQQAGTLQDTPQQKVVVEEQVIKIVPAQPRVIYVPQYDPEVVYMAGPAYRPGLLAFGSGFLIGSWLNSDCDWSTRHVYYHGWAGPGWVSYSRPYVRINRIYVHDSYRQRVWVNPRYRSRPVVVNRTYVNRHVDRYEFNRRRPVDVRRGPRPGATPMERIDAARRARDGRGRTADAETRRPPSTMTREPRSRTPDAETRRPPSTMTREPRSRTADAETRRPPSTMTREPRSRTTDAETRRPPAVTNRTPPPSTSTDAAPTRTDSERTTSPTPRERKKKEQ